LIGSKVPGSTGLLREAVSGTATLNAGETLWIFLYGTGSREYYFETLTPLPVVDNAWRVEIDLTPDPGTYILYAVIVNATDTQPRSTGLIDVGHWLWSAGLWWMRAGLGPPIAAVGLLRVVLGGMGCGVVGVGPPVYV
jgi:hypothetical protein